MTTEGNDEKLVEQLIKSVEGSEAHLSFDAALKDFPKELRGVRPDGGPHSAWELLEHMRIAQRDILDFSVNNNYQALKWPDDYWPSSPVPKKEQDWDDAITNFKADRKQFEKLLRERSGELMQPFEHGEGQTLMREALLVGSHNSYHLGQIAYVKRLLTEKG